MPVVGAVRVNNPESQVAADMVILRQEGFVASTSFIFWSCVDPAQSGGARTASPHRFARLSGGACRLKAKVFVRSSFSHFLARSTRIKLGGAFFCFSMQIWMRCSCNCKYDVCAQSARRAGVRLNPCFNEKVVSQAGLGLRQLWRSQGGFILLGCFLTNCSNFAVPKTEPVSRSRNRGRFHALSKLYAPEEVL